MSTQTEAERFFNIISVVAAYAPLDVAVSLLSDAPDDAAPEIAPAVTRYICNCVLAMLPPDKDLTAFVEYRKAHAEHAPAAFRFRSHLVPGFPREAVFYQAAISLCFKPLDRAIPALHRTLTAKENPNCDTAEDVMRHELGLLCAFGTDY